ncbi:uncharacterized protein KNAG_0L01870 [Huiozyma naganishii CBS 8797]|uniref:Uncharacterized protein n=1 Tax=Huiozyma naganishii (strain ATCC MYA-139 / BCRC 22969 / CBS 8797 / KCTC 17520 / NBRC 10181 / NCYC 3082 / Yp74L-3) TaxID=1071383 RepID=J7SB73_HUIN7|nr:hypothetical protein KNAG_0L01870 [Kazachstania naganishii CBS 8797]CCK72806.1 hypothetical protein KNAG_0L01870 [Kazachstania naganishii CBS 8797]
MTSLDDSIISPQNMALLDNVTNYNREAVDYFHYEFGLGCDKLPMDWKILMKMRKHRLLRLPSCSMEDDVDYTMYMQRLHHCLWRRWSMELFGLQQKKCDPLSINWNKDTDVTVLYGPEFSSEAPASKEQQRALFGAPTAPQTISSKGVIDTPTIESGDEDSILYASSIDSSASSIFDSASRRRGSNGSVDRKLGLQFSDVVLKREISPRGDISEKCVRINDIKSRHHHRRHQHRHHNVHRQVVYSDASDYIMVEGGDLFYVN